MKALMIAASAAALACAIPAIAAAQTAAPTGFYANLGYTDFNLKPVNLGAIQGRVGYRFNNWVGVEGELAGGVKDDHADVATGLASPPTVRVTTKLKHEEAIYGVGFLPVSPNADLLARVGYGDTSGRGSALGTTVGAHGDSWNYGVGGQYHFDGVNGVRVDYTRQEFTNGTSGHGDVWAIAYSRRF
jgi:outer membrane immunogenic protein